MTEAAPESTLAADDLGPVPTEDTLNAMTVDDLVDTYQVPRGKKADVVDAVFEKFGVPRPKSGEVVLATNPLHSDAHYYDAGKPPIVATGTAVPASKAEQIIADAALGGVQIREVN